MFIQKFTSGVPYLVIILFTAGKGINNASSISEPLARNTLIRAIFDEVELDVSRFEYLLKEDSTNRAQNLDNVIDVLKYK